MAAESIALAVPVLMLGMVLPRYFPLAGVARHHRAARGPFGATGLPGGGTSHTFDSSYCFVGPGFTKNSSSA